LPDHTGQPDHATAWDSPAGCAALDSGVESLNAVGASRKALTLYGSFDGLAMKRDESGKTAGSYAGLRAAPRNALLFLAAPRSHHARRDAPPHS